MNILALGAHPDDIEIYMFGALAGWKVMGARLALAIATDGSKGGNLDPAELARIRKSEAAAAAALIDVAPRCSDFPMASLSRTPACRGAQGV